MNKSKKYSGVVVPMITPLTEQLEIDMGATERVVHHARKEVHLFMCEPIHNQQSSGGKCEEFRGNRMEDLPVRISEARRNWRRRHEDEDRRS